MAPLRQITACGGESGTLAAGTGQPRRRGRSPRRRWSLQGRDPRWAAGPSRRRSGAGTRGRRSWPVWRRCRRPTPDSLTSVSGEYWQVSASGKADAAKVRRYRTSAAVAGDPASSGAIVAAAATASAASVRAKAVCGMGPPGIGRGTLRATLLKDAQNESSIAWPDRPSPSRWQIVQSPRTPQRPASWRTSGGVGRSRSSSGWWATTSTCSSRCRAASLTAATMPRTSSRTPVWTPGAPGTGARSPRLPGPGWPPCA